MEGHRKLTPNNSFYVKLIILDKHDACLSPGYGSKYCPLCDSYMGMVRLKSLSLNQKSTTLFINVLYSMYIIPILLDRMGLSSIPHGSVLPYVNIGLRICMSTPVQEYCV